MADHQDAARSTHPAYQKGYAAGRRRGEMDALSAAKRDEEAVRYDLYFCAALTGLIQSGRWKTGDTPWATTAEYVTGAVAFAEEAMRQNRKRPR